jgi:hypothetical protein
MNEETTHINTMIKLITLNLSEREEEREREREREKREREREREREKEREKKRKRKKNCKIQGVDYLLLFQYLLEVNLLQFLLSQESFQTN